MMNSPMENVFTYLVFPNPSYICRKCQQSLRMIEEESHEAEARGWRPELQATENALVKLR